MTYIENIFICLAIPLILSLFFIKGRARSFVLFVTIGMGICLLSAYINSFFMRSYNTDAVVAAMEITPVCEEIMKLLPLLFYFLIFEPKEKQLPDAAIAIGVGFATFENVCYLTENGAANFYFMLIRGISAGALHLLCGIFEGSCISYVFCRKWLALTGTVGTLGACIGFHAIYNVLVTAEGTWQMVGYLFPSILIFCLFAVKQMMPRLRKIYHF